MINPQSIKQQFPVFQKYPDLAYLDTAASALKPQAVIDAVTDCYSGDYSNIHRGAHFLGDAATENYESARQKVADFINAPSAREVVFGKNATEMMNLVVNALGCSKFLGEGDTVLLTEMEHHANHVPWLMLQQYLGFTIEFLEVDIETKDLIYDEAKIARAKVISIPLISNVLGTCNSVAEINKYRTVDSLLVIDACQAVAHMSVDVQDLECDALVFSSHKLYGPSGVGVLWAKSELLKSWPPFLGGGEMIREVDFDSFIPNEIPYKFEAGTPPIAEVIGLGAAIDWILQYDWDDIQKHNQELVQYAILQLSCIDRFRLISHHDASGLVTFTIDGVNDFDLSDALSDQQICVRVGLHCAEPLHKKLGFKHSVRASFGLYSRTEDVDRMMNIIKGIPPF